MSVDITKMFYIKRGAYFPIYISFTDEDGTPISLAGKSVHLTVKKKLNDPDETAIIHKIITSHINESQGTSLIELLEVDTDVDESGVLQGEFRVVDGTKSTIFETSGFQFLQDVVQP